MYRYLIDTSLPKRLDERHKQAMFTAPVLNTRIVLRANVYNLILKDCLLFDLWFAIVKDKILVPAGNWLLRGR
ncbi:MAG: hypothetical protein ACJA13_000786 [Paraglaciecola sp.]|jgi:hypothetical protein